MQLTGQEIVERALRLIGKLGEGETPTAQAAQDARKYLNDILDQWQADHIRVFANNIQNTVNLTASQQDYTIGSGGDFNIVRPVRIIRAQTIPDSTADPKIEIPINVLTAQRWAALRQKTTTAAYPYALFYNKTMDTNARGQVSVYPIPTNTSAQLILWTEAQLETFTDLSTSFQFAPGYSRAMRENLAIALASEYGAEPPLRLVEQANEAMQIIERTNADDETMIVDPGLWKASGGYNIFTDEG